MNIPEEIKEAYEDWKVAESKLYESCDPGMLADVSRGYKASVTRKWNKLIVLIEKNRLKQTSVLADLTKIVDS